MNLRISELYSSEHASSIGVQVQFLTALGSLNRLMQNFFKKIVLKLANNSDRSDE